MRERTKAARPQRDVADAEQAHPSLAAECQRLRGIIAGQNVRLNGMQWALTTVGALIDRGYSQASKAVTDAAIATYGAKP